MSDEGGGEVLMEGWCGVGDVALGSEGRLRGVGNFWEWQVFGGIGFCRWLRGESPRFG